MTWSITNYNPLPSGNSTINGTNIAEGCNASGINDAIRQLMADLAAPAFGTGAASFGGTLAVAGAATLSGTSAHTGAATFASTVGVTGAITGSSTISASSTGAVTLNPAGPYVVVTAGAISSFYGGNSIINNDRFDIQASGSGGVGLAAGATSWGAYSDERLKTGLKPITDATAKVATLRAMTGRLKTDAEDVSRSMLIAQDVQKVLPEAVSEHEGFLQLRLAEVIPLLTAAHNELAGKVAALKDEVVSLKLAA